LEEAEKNFRELVRRSGQDDKFVIMTDDEPLARIIPFKKEYTRKLGTAKGKVIIKEGFKEIPGGFEDYIL
jgi:antitoxin (DNA-binding transcriptional repressor) of toxin-antitoxin stability system